MVELLDKTTAWHWTRLGHGPGQDYLYKASLTHLLHAGQDYRVALDKTGSAMEPLHGGRAVRGLVVVHRSIQGGLSRAHDFDSY